MSKMVIEVDIEDVLKMKAKLRYINTKAFDQIVWLRGGQALEFSKADVEEFKFMGLCNTDFVEFWLDMSQGEHLDD